MNQEDIMPSEAEGKRQIYAEYFKNQLIESRIDIAMSKKGRMMANGKWMKVIKRHNCWF